MSNNELMKFINYLRNNNFTDSTISNYCYGLKNFFDFLKKKNIDIDNFTNEDVNDFKNLIIKIDLPQTVNTKLFAIRKYIEHLKINKKISREYDFKTIKTETKKSLNVIKNFEDLINFANASTNNLKEKSRNVLLLKMLYFTGLRTKDLLNIKKKSIKKNKIIFSDKTIVINSDLLSDVYNYFKIMNLEDSDYLFTNFSRAYKNSAPKPKLTEKSVESIFNKYSKFFIEEKYSIRDLRNSFIINQRQRVIIKDKIYDVNIYELKSSYLDYYNGQ